jgi:hypothetical protein
VFVAIESIKKLKPNSVALPRNRTISTSSGLDSATFYLVAQCLNHLRYLVKKVTEYVMELQVLQNISDTVSPLDKMLLERKEECWMMLNKTFVATSVTTAAPGKRHWSLESLFLILIL